MCFVLRSRLHVIRIVVKIDVAAEQLLLPEGLLAHFALVWFLVCVHQYVGLKMARRNRSIWTEITFVAFFAFVCFGVHFVGVTVLVDFVASATLQGLFHWSVQFLYVDSKIRLSPTGSGAKLAVENWFVTN